MTEIQKVFITELVNKYFDTLVRLTFRRTKDEELSLDLAQSVFTVACLKVKALMEHPQPIAWLYKTLDNLLMNENKKASNRCEVELYETQHGSSASTDNQLPLEVLLPKGLSDSEKELLILRFQYSLSCMEIAKIKQISYSSCRKRLSRAMKHCQKLLSK